MPQHVLVAGVDPELAGDLFRPSNSVLARIGVRSGRCGLDLGSFVLRFALAAGRSAVDAAPDLARQSRRRRDQSAPRHLQVPALRLRPYDESRDRATNYRVFDERLLALYGRLAKAEYDDKQLQVFCRLMTSICRRTYR